MTNVRKTTAIVTRVFGQDTIVAARKNHSGEL
jgi:hypothetical protein